MTSENNPVTSDNTPPRQRPAEVSAIPLTEGSYVDWAAILAGSVFALALIFLLLSFGTGLGLSLASPYRGEGISATWLAIAAGIWFAWVMVTGFGAGGYFAGRLRRQAGDASLDEVELRDGAHGLMVWSTGALVSIVISFAGVGGLLGAGASAVGTVTDVAAEAASSDYFANVMLRSAGGESRTIDTEVQQEVASVITRSAVSGEMAERDRNYLAQVVAAHSGLDPAAARNRVDEVNAEIADARAEAADIAEKARVAGVVFGFIVAATLLIGAAAAYFAAAAGGRHRDEGLSLNFLTLRR
ncbi:MAG: hypothetical protein WEB93_01400 [Sphingomonadales bacterium]